MVELNDPQEHGIYQVGFMGFSVHGSGYLFPWTYAETLAKLRNHPVLSPIRDLCRTLWPATSTVPRKEIIEGRRTMGKLWAEPLDAPLDWYWAINETY